MTRPIQGEKEVVPMTIERIDMERCVGCGTCIDSCPMDVFRMDDESKKAVIRYPEDCMLCHFCEIDCPENAIYVSPEKSTPMLMSWG
jgi:NAD-dependent dihydropyrimidine dehydrogenase PreA subunit